MDNVLGEPLPPEDCFREIGFDTEMYFDGCRETIFFVFGDTRRNKVSKEAVEEFVAYWQNQIDVARDYVKNGCNPKTHEWKKDGARNKS